MVHALGELCEELERHLDGDELAAVLAVVVQRAGLLGAARGRGVQAVGFHRDDEELGCVPILRGGHRLEAHRPWVGVDDRADRVEGVGLGAVVVEVRARVGVALLREERSMLGVVDRVSLSRGPGRIEIGRADREVRRIRDAERRRHQ